MHGLIHRYIFYGGYGRQAYGRSAVFSFYDGYWNRFYYTTSSSVYMALDNAVPNQLNIGGALGIAGLVTAQNGLTVSSGATSVAALTASGLVTVGTKGTPYKSIVSIIQTIGASAVNNQSNTTNLTPYSYTDSSKLIVNITMGNCGTGDVFISCLTSISTTLLTFRIYRLDTNAGWGTTVMQANITIYELA